MSTATNALVSKMAASQMQAQAKANPIAFVMQHAAKLRSMPQDFQVNFASHLFDTYLAPRLLSGGTSAPNPSELMQAKIKFAATLLGVPIGPLQNFSGAAGQRSPTLSERLSNTTAGLKSEAYGAAAGTVGSIKTIDELIDKLTKAQGDNWPAKLSGAEHILYSKAQSTDPTESGIMAKIGAATGHNIPAIMAGELGGELAPEIKGSKLASGALKGAASGAAFGASYPGMGASSGALYGAPFGAAAEVLGAGKEAMVARRTAKAAAKEVTKVPSEAAASGTATAEAPKSLADLREQLSQRNFNKPFKDLSEAQRRQLPKAMKEEIQRAKTEKAAKLKATITQKRIEKAAAKQAGLKTPVEVPKPSVSEAAATAKQDAAKAVVERKAGASPEEIQAKIQSAQTAEHNPQVAGAISGIKTLAGEPEQAATETVEGSKPPAGSVGSKLRKQRLDRERIAAKREASTHEQMATSLEGIAREVAGRAHPDVSNLPLPEMEDELKSIDPSALSTLKSLFKKGAIPEEEYREGVKQYLLLHFSGKLGR